MRANPMPPNTYGVNPVWLGNWTRAPPMEYHVGTRACAVVVRPLLADSALTVLLTLVSSVDQWISRTFPTLPKSTTLGATLKPTSPSSSADVFDPVSRD